MKTINFKEFSIYTSISRNGQYVADVRESVANILYLNVSGIRAHSLALKIYQSDGSAGYTDDEVKLIQEVTNKYCLPNFIDSLNDIIDNQ
jgi:hypothetical protein|nr:MAG TPA: hypothetical protein [Caudoviricetes sp.]